jgi:hypothetical protein
LITSLHPVQICNSDGMRAKTKLVLIKSVHTLIWLIFVTLIFVVFWSGITGDISVYSWIAAASVILEGLVLLVFGGSCPLTLIAKRYSNSSRDNFDIYLPNWLARYNKLLFGSLYCIGLVLLLLRYFMS